MGNIFSKIIVVGLANSSIAMEDAGVNAPCLRWLSEQNSRNSSPSNAISNEDTSEEGLPQVNVQEFLEEAAEALMRAQDSQKVRITIDDDPSGLPLRRVITTTDGNPLPRGYAIEPNTEFDELYEQGLVEDLEFVKEETAGVVTFSRFGLRFPDGSRPLTTGHWRRVSAPTARGEEADYHRRLHLRQQSQTSAFYEQRVEACATEILRNQYPEICDD